MTTLALGLTTREGRRSMTVPLVVPLRRPGEASVISEVTRRNVFDAIIAAQLPWAGRFQEDEFLSRIYELEKMPSNDHRYKTARGDVHMHTVSFTDWEPGWVLHDERFELMWGPDELFLRFLAETLHPVVRADAQDVGQLLAIYNEHLEKDGWTLAPATTLSGRPVFEGQRAGTALPPEPPAGSAATASLGEFLPPELGNRFQMLHELGTGSFGSVYQVIDVESLQRFALKIARNNPEARERARRERDAGTRLSHPNILEIIEHHADAHWFIQPLADGTLGQLQSWGKAGPKNARELALAVGSALAHAHDAQFLHRDLHPDNILRHDGVWKVADWGLTKATDHQRMTRTKSVGGGATWTAPEQVRSLKDADARSDLFSLGRLVEWLASAKLPNPATPGDLGEHPLAAFVAAATRLDRAERPADVHEALKLIPGQASEAEAAGEPSSVVSTATHALRAPDQNVKGVAQTECVVHLTLDYKKVRITQAHHDYQLVVNMKNVARRRLDDWELEIEFPTPLLGGTVYGIKVDERSDATTTLFRIEGHKLNKPLRPGDQYGMTIAYFVNSEIYRERHALFEQTAKARALIDGTIVAELERPLSELQVF